jgi:hypothetical protein
MKGRAVLYRVFHRRDARCRYRFESHAILGAVPAWLASLDTVHSGQSQEFRAGPLGSDTACSGHHGATLAIVKVAVEISHQF